MNITEKVYLTDGRKNIICLPYTEENLHEMAKELEIPERYFNKNRYTIPDTLRDNIEDKCSFVSSQTLFRTIYKVI